jgi:hypothetical protein
MDFKKGIIFLLCATPLISGCDTTETEVIAAKSQPESIINRAEEALIIAPMIEGFGYCDQPQFSNASTQQGLHYQHCKKNGFTIVDNLKQQLDTLEPGGAKGKVQVGYTYGITLLSLYAKTDNGWKLDIERIDKIFDNIKSIDRPAIIYLMMNHFDSHSELSKELAKDHNNLLLMANGKPPLDTYFETSIIPYTLSTDESIAVNRYRFSAFRAIIERYSLLTDSEKRKIHAFSMIGELHHMFQNFQGGTGKFSDIKLTDYSASSIKGFRQWLQTKYQAITALNKKLGTNFNNWDDIQAPDKDIRIEKLTSFSQHIDSYAHGKLPIFGWAWEKKPGYLNSIKVYIDGKYSGNADMHLNRLDVYQALEKLATPNVGFRYEVDFSQLIPGIHTLQLIASTTDGEYQMMHREFSYVDRDQSMPAKIEVPTSDKALPKASSLKHLKFHVDHPKPLQDVYYNPLAKQWNTYRNAQVEKFITHVWSIAVAAGADKAKLFSHQLAPYMNGSWNTVLFGTDQSLSEQSKYLPGITLYGGSTDSKQVKENFPVIVHKRYGVPEYHSQQHKSYQKTFDALNSHFEGNASFVTPYYMSVVPKEFQTKSDHLKFLIDPNNKEYGSHFLFNAIQKMALQ